MEYLHMVQEHIELAMGLTNALFLSLAPLYQENHGREQEVTVPLFTLLHSTSSNILNLVIERMALHDADVLLRTVMEGTVKYCYLLNGTPEERYRKYNEYRFMLYDLEQIADHNKAIETLEIFREFDIQNSTLPFEANILPDEQRNIIHSKYSKKAKDELKRRWTYQAMLRSLAESRNEYKAQLGTLSTYASTSHYAHFDWSGLSSRLAQLHAVAKEETANYDIAHCYRIVSNILSFELIRALEYIQVYGLKSRESLQIIEEVFNETSKLDALANELLAFVE